MAARGTLLIAVLAFSMPAWGAPRTWTDQSGKFSVEAELIDVQDGKARLKKADGTILAVSLQKLSVADRRYVERLGRPAAAAPADRITGLLAKIRVGSDVPALAGAIVTSRGVLAAGVTGVRKRGEPAPATLDDHWHLGSNTKTMTATLVARLVEQGVLKWDQRLVDCFPDDDVEIHPDLQSVTITQLLSHRAGLPANLDPTRYGGLSGPETRKRAVTQELAKPPQSQPGTKFSYSNLGYIIVGAIIEKATGKSWRENLRQHVLQPLEMESAGFGGTGTPGKLDQPWGHLADGTPAPANGPIMDNPPVMGPAGRVHCTLADWAKFVVDHLRGLQDQPALLPAAAYRKLTEPPTGGDYALGWVITRRDWGGGRVLAHNGSNTMNYATVWVAPRRDFAVLVCCNQGGQSAQKATDTAAVVLIDLHAQLAEKTR